jgi:hypothetical protein
MEMFAVFLLAVVIHPVEPAVPDRVPGSGDEQDTCQSLKLEAQQIRREGYTAIDKADSIREQAYRVKDEAFEMKETEMAARSELETTLVETIALIRSQSTVTNLYIQEIRGTLSDMKNRMEKIEERIEGIEERMEKQEKKGEERFTTLSDHSETIEKKMVEQAAVSGSIASHVIETLSTARTLKTRQEAQISEVRIISLYKVTDQNNPNPERSYESDLAVDGMMTFDRHHWGDMRAYTHTASKATGNKLWLELGGLFRIHKIKVWNLRHCCQEQLIGAHVYADSRLIGTVIRSQGSYDFPVADEDTVHAREVTLLQPLGQHIHILELQVWGTGPYMEDDTFS